MSTNMSNSSKPRPQRPASFPSLARPPLSASAASEARTRALQAVRLQMRDHKQATETRAASRGKGKENIVPTPPKTSRTPAARVGSVRVSAARPKSPISDVKKARRTSAPPPSRPVVRPVATLVARKPLQTKPAQTKAAPFRPATAPKPTMAPTPRAPAKVPPPITRPVRRMKCIRPVPLVGAAAPPRQSTGVFPPARQHLLHNDSCSTEKPECKPEDPVVVSPDPEAAVQEEPEADESEMPEGPNPDLKNAQTEVTSAAVSSILNPSTSAQSEDVALVHRSRQLRKNPSLASTATSPTLNDFTILKHLGHGAFGTVYLTKPTCMNKLCAVKVLNKVSAEAEGTERQIYEEAKVLRTVTGASFLMGIHASFHDAANFYLIMDYCPSNLLATYRKNRNIPIDHIRFWACELAVGIKALHSLNIVHRDLKLENILLRPDGHIAIADFGLSKILHEPAPAPAAAPVTHRTPAGKIIAPLKRTKAGGRIVAELKKATAKGRVGTRNYMAPEIWAKKPYSYSVDWFAFGVILYMLQYHKFPWGGNDEEVESGILSKHPVFPEGVKFDKDCADITRHLLVKNPAHRASFEEVKASQFFADMCVICSFSDVKSYSCNSQRLASGRCAWIHR
ncbi:kinase-like protein [Auriscalpium vulgare]|uniref:Kinase-like protein n=1 Tax=Auriscalpium vulgare TaxID=40419 RepID=A0ACB8S6W0_9AGAM|nr:kinase-like protein [Auriscalpium vulgare]